MQGIKILGTASYIPETEITNEDFTKIIETSDEWISTRTGIKTRHFAMGMPTWKLGFNAAEKAIKRSGISRDEIDLIICSTVTPDNFTPSASCLIQRELEMFGCMAIDINCACSGFVYAVDMAQKYLMSGEFRNILVVSTEELSKYTNYEDRASCILFGDGAAAAVIQAADAPYSSFLGADGRGSGYLWAPCIKCEPHPFFKIKNKDTCMPEDNRGLLYQDGKEVYKFAVGVMPLAIKKVIEKSHITADDVDLIIPHQANIRIIQTAASKLGIPMDRFYMNIHDYGNTSSASIPIALNEAVENGILKRGDTVILVGFGAGLTYGAICIQY